MGLNIYTWKVESKLPTISNKPNPQLLYVIRKLDESDIKNWMAPSRQEMEILSGNVKEKLYQDS